MQLRDTTLHAFLEDIDYDKLPLTFKDAITVTRRLGIKHLWIDSLCIIQKQPSMVDWHKEAPTMQSVYGNSFCNIAAVNARSSTEGLFRQRRISGLPPSTVTVKWAGESMRCKVVREDFWDGELLSEPLYHRAWVFQGQYPFAAFATIRLIFTILIIAIQSVCCHHGYYTSESIWSSGNVHQ